MFSLQHQNEFQLIVLHPCFVCCHLDLRHDLLVYLWTLRLAFFLFSHTDHAIIQGFRKMQHETRREEKLVGLGWTISKKILPCPRIACYLAL